MDFSVLTPEFRQQLEEQLDRLISERDAIVQTAVEHATRTIDANLSHMTALLGKTDDKLNVLNPMVEQENPITKKPSTKTKTKPSAAIVPELDEDEPEESQTESPKASKRNLKETSSPSSVFNALKVSKASKASKASKKGSLKPSSTAGPQLTHDFEGLELADAIPAVFRQDPDRHFFIDDVIEVLYGTVESTILPKTRQRVAVSLGHSARRQEVRKVQDHPSIYCLYTEDEE